MSHELRTPLNSILGYTQLLLRGTGQSDDQRHKLKTVLSSGEHLLEMINEVLDLSKIEAGTVSVSMHPLQVRRLLRSLVDEFELRAGQKQLRFTYSLDGAIPDWIGTDPVRLRQVLYNLIGNAIKVHLCRRGITARPTIGQSDAIRGDGHRQRNSSKRIFQISSNLFIRRPTTTKPAQGVGLGLYISKRIIDLLGGELHVTSSVGSGSTFWFELPLKETSVPQSEVRTGRISGYDGASKKITGGRRRRRKPTVSERASRECWVQCERSFVRQSSAGSGASGKF